LLLLPRRGSLARAQANDRVADTQRLARLHGQITADAVALVEQADHGAALCHWRAAGIDRGGITFHRHHVGRRLFGHRIRHLLARCGCRFAGIVTEPLRTLPHADAQQGGAADRGRRNRRLHASGLHAS
jgi:hypothetical protein